MSHPFPLLLLPGLLNDGDLWREQIAGLGDLATPVVGDLTRHASIAAMAADLLGRMPDYFSLAGLSMGGYVAQEIMRQARHRVLRLALLDTSARADNEEQHARRHGLVELANKGQFKGVTPRLLPMILHRKHLADEALTGRVLAMAERVGHDGFVRQQTAILDRVDGRADLARITCPTLILCGREDALTPPALHEEMAAAIPGSRLVIVEESGHLSAMEQPTAVTAAMRDWLES